MSAEIRETERAIEWLDAPHVPEHRPGQALREWLAYRGLLTVRLKQACGEGFRLQLLGDSAGPGLMVNEEWIRRVILWCGDVPCVYAESFLPQEALALLPSLRKLGNDPLGEILQSHPDVSRGPFEYALLRSPRLPASIAADIEGPLWARRSRFSVGGQNLTVAEAFLPGMLEQLVQRSGDSR